jgi:hypothetical protein
MFLALDTCTVQCINRLSLIRTVHALEFPRNRTDTQPPPATALRDAPFCWDSTGTAARALFSTIKQPVTLTLEISSAATAPPHAEHGSLDRFAGHPVTLPIAELCEKLLFLTSRNKPRPRPVADIAPPLAALQLRNRHCDTVTLLSKADKAPPLLFAFEQFLNVMPMNVTLEFVMRKAAPVVGCCRRPQSKRVDEGTPLMTRDTMLLMLTVDSLKIPALRFTWEAPTT